jgi:hypothetical protein
VTDWIRQLRGADAAALRALAEKAQLDELRAAIAVAQRDERREAARVPRRFWYDCEFLEDGRTIDLISIGIVAEDGREFYRVNADAPWRRIARHEWLMSNVVPHLPGGGTSAPRRIGLPRMHLIDHDDPAVIPHAQIAEEVRAFLLGPDARGRAVGERGIELWAWYGAYDHVCLAQLFGPMVNLPPIIPMWTNDLKQEAVRLGDPALPEQPHGLHNALEDARFLKRRYDWLRVYAAERSGPELLI